MADTTFSDSGYLPYPYSLDPLPTSLQKGLLVVGLLSSVSLVATFSLLVFLTYKLFLEVDRRRSEIRTELRHNQSLVLIYNLLLADFQQAIAFVLNLHWVRQNAILAPSTTCSAQGWFVSMGDLSSGIFSLAIAVQTFITVIYRRKIPHRWFVAGVIGLWAMALILSMIGPLIHRNKNDFFTRASAWCWVSDHYEDERLFLHYLWIFICEFGIVVLYLGLFFVLRSRIIDSVNGSTRTDGSPGNQSKLQQIARYMLVYPTAYIIFTLPLAAGRMASYAGNQPSNTFFCVAGAMMGSCGWVDVILYNFTRRTIVLVNSASTRDMVGLRDQSQAGSRVGYGTVTTIVNITKQDGSKVEMAAIAAGSSVENIVRLEQAVEIVSEPAYTELRGPRLHEGQHPWCQVRKL